MYRSVRGLLELVATVLTAAVVGFGVPLGWVYIGSQLQGDDGASSLSFTVAVATLAGIVVSYLVIMYGAGWLILRRSRSEQGQSGRRQADSWARRSAETRGRQRGRNSSAVGIEQVFVYTTLIVAGAFWIWFLFFAGSPLPSQ